MPQRQQPGGFLDVAGQPLADVPSPQVECVAGFLDVTHGGDGPGSGVDGCAGLLLHVVLPAFGRRFLPGGASGAYAYP